MALSSDSLNERQKAKIVDTISSASSVKEAKIIYETLQSAVAPISKNEPKSLREAVYKRTFSTIHNGTKSEASVEVEDPAINRMKILAGLK